MYLPGNSSSSTWFLNYISLLIFKKKNHFIVEGFPFGMNE